MYEPPRVDASSQAAAGVAPNYLYWQENGAEWLTEYHDRRLHQPKYLLQEVLLNACVEALKPRRVLEFGCGVGRHLRYLSQLPGLEVMGVDQSPTMMAGISSWADPSWAASHVFRVEPVGRLPFRDGEFDLVFTSEVLVHVRPEDLPTILSELRRVSRGQVLHFEPIPGDTLHSGAHGGCWSHNLAAVWQTLNEHCDSPGPFCADQAVFWTPLSSGRAAPFAPQLLERTRLLEQVLTGVAVDAELHKTVNLLRQELDERNVSLTAARNLIERLVQRDAAAGRDRMRLSTLRAAIKNTVTQGIAALRVPTARRARYALLPELSSLVSRIEELERERALLTNSLSSRVGRRVARFMSGLPSASVLSRLAGRPGVRIEVLHQRTTASKGNEVWLLQACFGDDGAPYPLSLASFSEADASLIKDEGVPYSRALVARRPTRVELFVHPHAGRLVFLRHDWSGRVAITSRGRTQVVDLYSATPDALEVDLGAWPFALRKGDARRQEG